MASKTNFIYGDCNARKYAKKYTKNYATLLEMVNCWIFKVHFRHIILFVLLLKFCCEVEQSGLKCGVKCHTSSFYYKHICCILVWVVHSPNAGWIMIFYVFFHVFARFLFLNDIKLGASIFFIFASKPYESMQKMHISDSLLSA